MGRGFPGLQSCYLLPDGPPALPSSAALPLEFGRDQKSFPLVGAEAEPRGQGERPGVPEAPQSYEGLEGRWKRLDSLDGNSGWIQLDAADNRKVNKTCRKRPAPGFPGEAHWGCSQIGTGSVGETGGKTPRGAGKRVGTPLARPQGHSGTYEEGQPPRLAPGPASTY